jgi:5-methyltetrahydrofolate--homocysteine methyltransferase
VTTSRFEDDLAAGAIVLCDAATGTALLGYGPEPARRCLDAAPLVAEVHRRHLAAGAEVLLTNSFAALGATTDRGAVDLARRCCGRAAAIARAVADAAGTRVTVAGSLGPPAGGATVTHLTLLAAALRDEGAELLWFETLSDRDEAHLAATVAGAVGLPYVITWSFHRHGRTGRGWTPGDLAASVSDLARPPLAIGANCGNGPDDVVDAALRLAKATPLPVIARPSAGVPDRGTSTDRSPGAPTAFADAARRAVAGGIRVLGGCCGTGSEHLAALDAARGPTPTRGE